METEENENLGFKPLIITGIIIITILIITPIIVNSIIDNWTDRGTFGDLFGVVNALFSGLAFAGIIYTILLQRTELKLQRQELKETRLELKRSADSQEKTSKAFNEQIVTMNQTAKINGISSIVSFYNSQAEMKSSKGESNSTELSENIKYVNKIIIVMNEIEEREKANAQHHI